MVWIIVVCFVLLLDVISTMSLMFVVLELAYGKEEEEDDCKTVDWNVLLLSTCAILPPSDNDADEVDGFSLVVGAMN